MTETQVPRQKRFFETTLGGVTIAAAVLAAIGVLIYVTQFANPSYEESRRDAELACADLIDLETSTLDTSEFDECVEFEMNH